MESFKSFCLRYWYFLVIILLLCLLGVCSIFGYKFYHENTQLKVKDNSTKLNSIAINNNDEKDNDKEKLLCNVDVKGAVKKPGVYNVSCDTIINDVIKLAGGILKTGTTKNINLSKVIKDELVIYVYKKNELKNSVNLPYNNECRSNTIYIDTCIKDEKSVIETDISSNDSVEQSSKSNSEEAESEVKENKLISINTASIDELTTLSGIGTSKAEKIIEYREQNEGFKSIEELKNVSGIGEALFAKIKDRITI